MGTVRFNTQRSAWMIDYVAATGQRIRQIIGSGEEGRRLAKQVLRQREAEAALGLHRLPAARTPTFAEFAEGWLERQRARGLRPKTLEADEDNLATHLVPAFGEMRLGAIGRREIDDFLVAKTKARRTYRRNGKAVPYAPATINKMLRILKTILRDATERGYLRESPKVGLLQVPDREDGLQVLQPEEIDRLLDAAEEPWRTLYLVAVHTGLRRGELLGLKWGDLDLREGLLHVRRSLSRIREGEAYAVRETPLKTRYARRTLDFSSTVKEALLALPVGDDAGHEYLFRSRAGGPIDPDNVDRAWKRHLTAAGLADRPFHSTRHTHAALLVAAGAHPKAIQARLGHASITTTLNTFGHLMSSAYAGVGDRVETLLKATARQQAPHDDGRGTQPIAETRAIRGDSVVGEAGVEPATSSV